MAILNYKIVDAVLNIRRGGQCRTEEDFQILITDGIKNFVQLDTESEGDDEKMCIKYGLCLMKNPITFADQFLVEPNLDALKCIVSWIGPDTYIHCLHGEDRTGLVVALYRILVQGWTVKRAKQEMYDNGFHRILFGLDKAFYDLTKK